MPGDVRATVTAAGCKQLAGDPADALSGKGRVGAGRLGLGPSARSKREGPTAVQEVRIRAVQVEGG